MPIVPLTTFFATAVSGMAFFLGASIAVGSLMQEFIDAQEDQDLLAANTGKDAAPSAEK